MKFPINKLFKLLDFSILYFLPKIFSVIKIGKIVEVENSLDKNLMI